MFNPANETHFSLHIPGLKHDLQVLEFHGREAISQPYRIEVSTISENPNIEVADLLHQPVFLGFTPDGLGIHGLIFQVGIDVVGRRLTHYQLSIVPELSYLSLRTNQRIFQQQTVPQIIAQVLEDHGILAGAYQFALGPTVYPERDYCVQYDETDLHFVQRLCEEEGIHYHFQHSKDGHILTFGDDQSGFSTLAKPVAYQQDSGLVADECVIKNFSLRLATRSSRVSRRDYSFKTPNVVMHADYKGEQADQNKSLPDLEDYDYPAGFTDRDRGRHLSKRSLERHRADYRLAEGNSDQPMLLSGHFLELSEHPKAEYNDLWLLHEVSHQGKQPQVLEEYANSNSGVRLSFLQGDYRQGGSPQGGFWQDDYSQGDGFPQSGFPKDDFQQGYRNRFSATPWDVPFRPPLNHPKPRMLGGQTAVVTGPKGEEIHCDQHGRIKVQFHWDREGQGDDKSSCWLRVASNWAGDRYGGVAVPRVGMEVLVEFLESDPDQPMVTGCLFHAKHMPPYELPAHKTRSTFKTLSTPGGGGYNELRVEDKKGDEQIYLHAQRDWDENVENDQKIRVGNQRHDLVEANSFSELKAEEHLTVRADRKVEVKPDDHLTVGVSQHIRLGAAQLTKAGREIHLKAGQKMVIEAGTELTVSAGGSFIKLDPSGITLSGAIVRANAGGSPGKGSGIGIKPPVLPGMADSDKAGNLLDPALAGTPLNSPKKLKRMLSFSG